MTKQILVLSQYWYPENGVPQRRWTWLTKILVDAGYEVTVITPPPHYQRKLDLRTWWRERRYASRLETDLGPSGEHIVRSGFIPSGDSLTLKALNQATVALGSLWVVLKRPGKLRGYRPDLIIGTVPALPTAAATWLTAARFRAPYVIDLRDAWPDLLKEAENWNRSTGVRSLRERILTKGPLQLLSAVTRKAINHALKNAAGITVTSSYLAENLATRRELWVNGNPPPIETVRNVFPPETAFVKNHDAQNTSDGLNVLYAGTFGRAQNLDNALRAAELAKARGVNVSVTFVGAGVTRDALVKSAREKDVDVRFVNRRPAEDLASFYEWADTALVHLTDWEALDRAVPSKTYELMSSGVHISGVVNGEAAELIRLQRSGDVVEPENPEALADLWVSLARNRSRLKVSSEGATWAEKERRSEAPDRLLSLVKRALA
ncbi:MAG: glycosyltransferase family 4 protein [Corynebacterium sp.]|uniref:glycosyltransferase family 4 protein n=1 Tax=Corynebacterium sp. TaxID=1720 RepID=UPI0026DEC312|nr:glycosyltransferase family 4 protein [Corynebacterium sp.]MDO5668793.1 glycosyltransferase family 4 protein [Corynebacterium sp.]